MLVSDRSLGTEFNGIIIRTTVDNNIRKPVVILCRIFPGKKIRQVFHHINKIMVFNPAFNLV